jgi:hypothetical protein
MKIRVCHPTPQPRPIPIPARILPTYTTVCSSKSNFHRKLSDLDWGSCRDRALLQGFKNEYKRQSNKRSRHVSCETS